MKRETVWVMGWPKSGTTWLTWLIADALNSPTGARKDELTADEFVIDGKNRPGPYIVRRTHKPPLDDGVTFFIVRDPRAIVASAMNYWDATFDKRFSNLVNNRNLTSWPEYVEAMLKTDCILTRYEDLLADCKGELLRILKLSGLKFDNSRLDGVCTRQSFVNKSKTRQTQSRIIPERFFWRGKTDTWRDVLTWEQQKRIVCAFGDTMEMLGYDY